VFYSDVDSKDFYDKMYEKEFELLRKLKKQYKEELEDELNYIYHINFKDKIFSEQKERFIQIIKEFYNYIDAQPSTISIKINYQVYKKDYYKQICYYLYKNWEISKVHNFVNNNLNITETDNLKTTRRKMNIAINEILFTVMNEFKSYDSYKELESIILGIRDGFTTVILWGYLDIEKAKKDFKNKILTEILKYNKRKQMILELKMYYGNNTLLVTELYNNILNEDKFNNIYNKHINASKRIKIKLKKIFSR